MVSSALLPGPAWAVVYALLLWWGSTGVIIYLDLLPRQTFRWSMLAWTLVAAASLWDLTATRQDTSLAGAYHAFTGGLLVWGWQLVAFYMGYITGPQTEPCAEDCHGWRRFVHGVRVCLYHEVVAVAGLAAIAFLTWGGANQIGTWTYLLLWALHLSAKLNVFLGVPNLNAHFLPAHLDLLKSLMRVRPMNLLFPVSMTVSLVVVTLLTERAVTADGVFLATGYTFVVTMAALGILEHWCLVLPLPAEALWAWSLKARRFVERGQRPRPDRPQAKWSASDFTVIDAALSAPAIPTSSGRQ